MATSRRWRGQDGENREETTWFRIAVYGRQAQTSAQYLQKGRRVLVTGRVSARAFIGNDGQPRASLEVVAQDVRFMGGRDEMEAESDAYGGGSYGDASAGASSPPPAAVQSQTTAPATPATDPEDDFDDDDIPF